MENKIRVMVTVYTDAAKAELCDAWKRETVGWFNDEIDAIGAACERVILRSAILADLRKLPAMAVTCEYRKMRSGKEPQQFSRATAAKESELGRRIVMLPGASAKPWTEPQGRVVSIR